MIAEDLDYFEKIYGEPENAILPNENDLNHFRGRLPDVLLEYWQHFGFAAFPKGRLQLVNPRDYAIALQFWISGSELVNKDKYHVIMASSFGKLRVWGEQSGYVFTIAPLHSQIHLSNSDNTRDIANGEADYCMENFLLGPTPENLDYDDDKGPMFARSRERLGALKSDEIYGFAPALQLGGTWTEKNLQKVSGPEHLHMLRGLARPRILTFRELGKVAFGDTAYDLIKDDL